MDERDIIRRARNGDLKAFEELVALYRRRVYAFALYHTRSRADAEDISQEVFWKVYTSLLRFDPERKFFSWLYAIEMNVIRTFRRRRKIRTVPMDDVDPDWFGFQDRGLLTVDDRHVVLQELAKLEERERHMVYLKYVDDLSIREIAEEFSLTEENVKVRLHRIREKMQKNSTEAAHETAVC